MAIAYEQFDGEILAAEDDIISSASEDAQSLEQGQGRLEFQGHTQVRPQHVQHVQGTPEFLQNKWPKQIGILHLFWGTLVFITGVAQVIVVPMIEDNTSTYWKPSLGKHNCYGVTLWASLMLLLSGTLGLRAALYQNTCNLYAFVTVIMFEVLIFPGVIILDLVAYSSFWITPTAFPAGSSLFCVSVLGSVGVMLGLVFVLLAFIQYYEEVFCGEVQLCRRCIHACLPCWCPQAVTQRELYIDEETRSPSLPV